MVYKFIYFAFVIMHLTSTTAIGQAIASGRLFHSLSLEKDFRYVFGLVMIFLLNFVLIQQVYKLNLSRRVSHVNILYIDILPMVAGFVIGMYFM